MYHHCITCFGDLGRNAALEAFPVGHTLAFDAPRGRLWAVCPRCGRWNLAPLEERWEAVEGAERLFRQARQRVHRENIGVADLGDRTRLIRVGAALPAELSEWRYGRALRHRLRRSLAVTAGAVMVGVGALSGTAAAAVALPVGYGWLVADAAIRRRHEREVIHILAGAEDRGPLRWGEVARVTLHPGADDAIAAVVHRRGEALPPVELEGADARAFLARVLAKANPWGGSARAVRVARGLVGSTAGAGEYLRERARGGAGIRVPEAGSSALHLGRLVGLARSLRRADSPADPARLPPSVASLALEIALGEDGERRALDGELRLLQDQWRRAEEIASIADTLPDDPLARWLRDGRRSPADTE